MSESFFPPLTKKFSELEAGTDADIDILSFLANVKDLVCIFDRLGSFMSPVKNDMNGNVTKLEKHLANNPQHNTFKKLIGADISRGTTRTRDSATESLLWLKRGLFFTWYLLSDTAGGNPDLSNSASKAYESNLKPFHGWMTSKVFALAFKAIPYRKDFLKNISNGVEEDRVVEDMKLFLNSMKPHLDSIEQYFMNNDLNDTKKV